MDSSLPGSFIHGIFQARILKWIAFPSPGDLPNSGIESTASATTPAIAGRFFTSSAVKNPPDNAGDAGSIPGLGRYPRGGIENPLQYSCQDNSMDRGAWQAKVHGVAKSRT